MAFCDGAVGRSSADLIGERVTLFGEDGLKEAGFVDVLGRDRSGLTGRQNLDGFGKRKPGADSQALWGRMRAEDRARIPVCAGDESFEVVLLECGRGCHRPILKRHLIR